MQIERLEIERFGGLEEVTIAGLGRGVQVLHGTNEIGKTSLLEFVRAIFFGFEGLFRRGVLDPQRPCSGRLVVAIGRGPRGDRDRHRFLLSGGTKGRGSRASPGPVTRTASSGSEATRATSSPSNGSMTTATPNRKSTCRISSAISTRRPSPM